MLHRLDVSLKRLPSSNIFFIASTEIECPPPRVVFRYPTRLEINKDLCECFYGIDSDRYIHEVCYEIIFSSKALKNPLIPMKLC